MDNDFSGKANTAQGFGLPPVPVGSEVERTGLTRPLSSNCSTSMVGDQASAYVNASGRGKEENKQEKETSWSRFLLIKRVEGDFHQVNPFTISKTLYGLIGEVKLVKKVKGMLLVETVSRAQSKKMCEKTRFAGMEVKVTPHPTLNYCKGVIYCPDLLNCTIDEIKEELKQEKVTDVRRIKIKRDGNWIDSPNHVLTFEKDSLPRSIKVAWYSLLVRPYIPNPQRCFNCQKYGHSAINCSNSKICVCGKPPHEGLPCENLKMCPNCKGDHLASWKGCHTYKTESKIREVMVIHKVSYGQAKVMAGSIVSRQASFAQAVSKTTQQSLLQDIAPTIRKIIKEEIVSTIKMHPPMLDKTEMLREIRNTIRQEVNNNRTLMGPPMLAVEAMEDESRGAKRKTDTKAASTDSMTSIDEKDVLDAKITKKKRGWPKGKPRIPREFESEDKSALT